MYLNNDSTPVIKLDESCVIVDCNAKACDFMGMETEDIAHRSISDFLKTDCKEQGPFSGEKNYIISRFYHFTGVVSDVVIFVNTDTKSGKRFYYLTILDVSSDKAILRKANNENIKSLAGRMAHDLNNILAGILGSLSILREGDYTEIEYDELLNNAEDGVIKARNITDRMLTFSRWGSGSVSDVKKVHRPVVEQADPEQSLDSARLLLLDDNPFVAGTTIGMLVTLGYIVDVVSDGEEVIRKYKEAMQSNDPYKVVILDLTIEGGTGGVETINHLLEVDPEAVVVLSSGFSGSEIMQNYRSMGFKATLSKPYTVRELFESLNYALGQ